MENVNDENVDTLNETNEETKNVYDEIVDRLNETNEETENVNDENVNTLNETNEETENVYDEIVDTLNEPAKETKNVDTLNETKKETKNVETMNKPKKETKNVFDEIVELIKTQKKEIGNSDVEEIPSIYYIGMPKTASTAIKFGFPEHSVAHWHSRGFFERKYGTDLLTKNKIDLYDIIIYIGKKYNFKPLIIECIREPVSMTLSRCLQHFKYDKPDCNCELCIWKRTDNKMDENLLKLVKSLMKGKVWFKAIYSVKRWKKFFEKELRHTFNPHNKYLYYNLDNVKIMFLRFEDIQMREKIFADAGYNHINEMYNVTENNPDVTNLNNFIKTNITFNEKELRRIFENKKVRIFYTSEELEGFKEKYRVFAETNRKKEVTKVIITEPKKIKENNDETEENNDETEENNDETEENNDETEENNDETEENNDETKEICEDNEQKSG